MTLRRKNKRDYWFIAIVAAAAVAIGSMIFALCNWEAIMDMFIGRGDYDAEIAAAAKKHGLDPDLVRALIYQESRFRANKRGKKGEIGLMQVLPAGAAAEWARVNKRRPPSSLALYNVELNLDIGCWYLARAKRRWRTYAHGTELALAEYNAGTSRAREWAPKAPDGEVIPRVKIASTRKYVSDIMKRYRKYAAETAEAERKKTALGEK